MTRAKNLIFLTLLTLCALWGSSICIAEKHPSEKYPSAKDKAIKNFTLTDMQNVKHVLSTYKGKWVIVNYWATWCPPCLEEVPDLVALYDSRKHKDVMVLGIVFDYENASEVTHYVNDMLMSYPVVLGDDEVIKQIGSAEVLPTTFIYNPEGMLIKIKRGLVTKQYLEETMAGAKVIDNKQKTRPL